MEDQVVRKRRKRKRQGLRVPWVAMFSGFVVVVILTVFIAIYFMPFVAYYQVETAIAEKNGDKLAAGVDLVELRKNLKAQRGQRVVKIGKPSDMAEVNLNDLLLKWSLLHSEADIDRMVTTEGFIAMLIEKQEVKTETVRAAIPERGLLKTIEHMIDVASFRYNSLSNFQVNVRDEKKRYSEYFTYTFQRKGIEWKLTKAQIPVL